MNFKSFLVSAGLKQSQTFAVTRRRGSPISTRISDSEFSKIKDKYIKANADATNWDAHDITAEWKDASTIDVKWALHHLHDDATKQTLQDTLDHATHHQTLQDKMAENNINTIAITAVAPSETHDIPGKSYVMIRDMDSNVNIKITITSI